MWKNIVEPDRPQMTIWRVHFASWICKATNTYSENVILIALPRRQWLRERPLSVTLHVHYPLLFILNEFFVISVWMKNRAERNTVFPFSESGVAEDSSFLGYDAVGLTSVTSGKGQVVRGDEGTTILSKRL